MAGTILDAGQRRLLRTILERGADAASGALSKWLDRPVRLEVGEVEQVEFAAATEAIGPGDTLVAACAMPVSGRLAGLLILAFEDRAGLALADLLQRQPVGTTTAWGDLERSAAQETANIVGCAFVNALAAHLPGGEAIVPGPPEFRHEFAASLLEFALMDQATEADRVLLFQTRFHAEAAALDWALVLAPTSAALAELARALAS